MRQAVNNLQSTFSGFNFVGADEVFKVCDQPHPVSVQALITNCAKGNVDVAMSKLEELWGQGYAAVDIVTTLFRVTKGMDALAEHIKLEFIKVCSPFLAFGRCQAFADLSDRVAGDWFHAHADPRGVHDGSPVGSPRRAAV